MYERNVGLINFEEATKRSAKAPVSRGPKNLSMAWDDTSFGLVREGSQDDRQKKETCYLVYCGNQWVSGCVDTTAERMISGGWETVEVERGKGSSKNQARVKQLFDFEDIEEDFLQFFNSIATDLLIFGEAFAEMTYGPDGLVANLYTVDSITMTTHFDMHGVITGYTQRLEKSTEVVRFEPREIIRWWLPDPKSKKKALSPIEKLKDPVFLDRSMVTWGEKFFRQGGKPSYWVGMGPDSNEVDASRYIKWYKENYTGMENAHIPPVMYGGSEIHEYGKGSIELDFDKSQDNQRDRALVVYGVPPAMLGIIESGNIGGGTGESQNKSFIYNKVIPLENRILEKLNYRAVKQGLFIEDWKVKTRHADYRDDKDIAEIENKEIGNGTLTRNEARQERGRTEVPGGDVPTITTGNAITPVARLQTMEQEQTQHAQLSLQGAQQAMQKLAQGDQDNSDNQDQPPEDKQPQQKDKNAKAKEALYRQWLREDLIEANNTGVMVAFFLKPSEAQALVLDTGEPIDELHCTLAFLGDKSQLGDTEALKRAVQTYAENAFTLQGCVSGIGRFTSVPDGEPTPVYASVDAPGLPEWRQDLVKTLQDAGFPPDTAHGYTPHITLSYIPVSDPMPIESVPAIDLSFDLLWLAIGDERYAYALEREEDNG
jgi:HK97 family phage portal protein